MPTNSDTQKGPTNLIVDSSDDGNDESLENLSLSSQSYASGSDEKHQLPPNNVKESSSFFQQHSSQNSPPKKHAKCTKKQKLELLKETQRLERGRF